MGRGELGITDRRLSAWPRVRAKFVEVFGADLRSLAALRVVLALLVLVDLGRRSTDLSAHYSDQGVPPPSDLETGYAFSLNLANGTPEFQALLFGLAALAALSMLVGYRTRLATFVVWLVVLSIQVRNPLILIAGDTLLLLLLFWSLFLPLGAVWSVDRLRSRLRSGVQRLAPRFFSMATVALFLQIALMYWFTAIRKSGEAWRWDGTALYYTLSGNRGLTWLGEYTLEFPTLLAALTFATLALEAFGPFLLFSPVLTGPIRTAAVLAFMSLHFGILVTMNVGLFPFIAGSCMVCFLPGWFWDRALPGLRAAPGRHPLRRWREAATHLARTRLLLPLRRLFSPGSHALSLAASRVERPASEASGGAGPSTPAEESERGRGAAAGSESKVLRSSLATNLLSLFLLLNVVCYNVAGVSSSVSMPGPAYALNSFLGLSQGWAMYAPGPSRDTGWWVVPAELESGEQVDLLPVIQNDYRPQEVSYEKPRDTAATVENWQKYMNYITLDTPTQRADRIEQRESFGRYLCRSWNERHTSEDSVESLRIIYMRQDLPPPGSQPPEPERKILHEHSCG